MNTCGKWKDEVKAILVVACISDGFDPEDERNLLETLTEADVVFSETTKSHRWWNDELRVAKIGENYIGYSWANSTGDTSLNDLGWEFDLDSATFYEPKEVIKVIFVPVEDN